MEQRRITHDDVYAARTNEQIERLYDEWAAEYDADLDRFRYSGPDEVAEVVARHVPAEGRILDAGAGTGISGEALARKGFRDLVAIDLSDGMLERARRKGVYREARVMALGEPLDFEDDSFDAVVAMGVFTVAHAGPEAFDELLRVTRPGGHIVVDIRPEYLHEFSDRFRELSDEGAWELVECTDPTPYVTEASGTTRLHQVWVHRVR